jgi:hypothetical protein
MRALNGEEMLVAWEHSRHRPEQEAALALLALAWPERSVGELAELPLADRNALLLELRIRTLGCQMEGRAPCPECGVQLEFALDARALAHGLREQMTENSEEFNGFAMRPANTQDLLACAEVTTDEEARLILLERTVRVKNANSDEAGTVEAGRESGLLGLPAPTFAALMERFELLNAAAEIQVQLQCAACEARPRVDLDIAHYLVREIGGAARHLMMEIHQLASAYGWSEQSIARMSGARRAAYLEMLNA